MSSGFSSISLSKDYINLKLTEQAKWTEILLLGDVPWFTFQTKGEKKPRYKFNKDTPLYNKYHFLVWK